MVVIVSIPKDFKAVALPISSGIVLIRFDPSRYFSSLVHLMNIDDGTSSILLFLKFRVVILGHSENSSGIARRPLSAMLNDIRLPHLPTIGDSVEI